MNIKSLKILEYYKVIDMLKEKTSSSLGLKYIERLKPSSNYNEVSQILQETSEAQAILIKRGGLSLGGIHDIELQVKKANIGSSLDPGQLLMVADTLRAARLLKNTLSGDNEENFNYPIIQGLTNSLYTYRDIEEKIYNAIVSEIDVSDNASSTLRDLRRRIIQKNQSIRSKLNSIITSTTYQKYLQDAIISIRGDRFVVPVKVEYRGQVPGIIHDQSSSGATLFVEPISIVEINNELRELRLKENEEIERILKELSGYIGEVSNEIISNQEILGKLDFIFAKGKLSVKMKAIEPVLNEDKYLNIKNGKHPLLNINEVVPNTIWIGKEFHTLVITGPNTGGKTVTLKTVGLFTLMTQSGLHIPADFGTSMCVFDNVFADIGDEQSIEQSLSTFSSHMTNIVSILSDITENSLVLFDELGAGTDPIEGAALAISILEDVQIAGAKCIATTHYSEIKHYALTKEGVENAAVEFSLETLSPTYRLLIGVPGKSNAFEISKRLGLSEYVIQRAKGFINTENIQLEDLLQNIEKNRLKAIEEKEEAQRLREEIQRLKEEYDEKIFKIEQQKEKILENAKKDAYKVTKEAKEKSDEIIKELRELEKEMASREKNKKVEDLRKEISKSMEGLQPSVQSMIIPKLAKKEIKDLKPGDDVKVVTLNQQGSVISVDNSKKEALIQIGIMKMNLPFASLEKSKKDPKSTVTQSTRKIIKSKLNSVKSEVDLRGMRFEEAMEEIDKYLDDAYVAGLERITIIHGVGTGALKSGIKEILKKHKHVKTSREGAYGEGGAGVTIVELR
jgi:DNA mismatch repair protein MutS2